ncbi:MAG: hypothetical protein M3N16_06690 [Actinomycetota bacterium]|nr:hypothetical protein [Actinomycetota bacterium]
MGLLRLLLADYLRRRLLGGRHRRHGGSPWRSPERYYGWGPPGYGYGMGRRRYGGPFGAPRPRGGVQVRGCGCCLPLPLGVLVTAALGLRGLLRARSR